MKALMDAEKDDITATVDYERDGTNYTLVVFKPCRFLASGPAVLVYDPDAPLVPCPGVGATTAWDALTNVCNSVGCKFVVSQGKVELGKIYQMYLDEKPEPDSKGDLSSQVNHGVP